MKKIIALLLVLVTLFTLVSCGKKAEPAPEATPEAAPEAAPKEENKPAEEEIEMPVQGDGEYTPSDEILVVANKGNPTGLCHLNVTAVSANNAHMVTLYDRLVGYDYENNAVVPSLAESWEYIDDTHVRFKLREDVYSHAGDHFTASDVIYTVTTGQTGGKLSNYYGMFNLAECKAESDYSVILATNNVDPFFLYTQNNQPLAMVVEASVNKSSLEEQSLAPNAGTGPYKFVEWADGSYVKLERNENYWGKTPYFAGVEIRIITEASARVMNLESGDVDIALDPDVKALDALIDNPAFNIINLPTTNITTMYLNCSTEPFNDANVRRAVASALNYEANLKIAAGGYGTLSDSYLPTNNVSYASPETSYFKNDIEAAKAFLAESAYPNGFEFELIYAENPTFGAFAEMIQNQLSELGITVKLTALASSEFDARLCAGDFQAEIINSSNPDPAVQTRYYDKRIDFNTMRGGCGYVDGTDELLALIDEAKVTVDAAKRNELYAQIQTILAQECPAIPIYSPNKLCATDGDIVGITLTEFCDIDYSKCYRQK